MKQTREKDLELLKWLKEFLEECRQVHDMTTVYEIKGHIRRLEKKLAEKEG